MFVRGISFEKRNDGRVKTSSIYRQVSSGRPQKRIQLDLKQIEEKEKQHVSICENNNNTTTPLEVKQHTSYLLRASRVVSV